MDAAVATRSETPLVRPGAGNASGAEIAPGRTVDQRVGRAAALGALIGLVVMSALGTAMALATGFDMTDSLGLGVFAGVWGGPGFGGMLGATLAYVRAADRPDEPDVIAIAAPVRERNTRVVAPTTAERGAA